MLTVPPDDVRVAINRGNRPARPLIDIVVPVFNEEAALPVFMARMDAHFAGREDVRVRYIFVNDGSHDGTLAWLWHSTGRRGDIAVIDLSRNFGKEAALTAGLFATTGDAAVLMDADLQHPPETVDVFLTKWRDGYDVVAGRRAHRDVDGPMRRLTGSMFYRVFNAISATPIPTDVGDFRLMDHRVIAAMRQLPESNRFMKGLLNWVGFPSTIVEYPCHERVAGRSRWNYRRLFSFALDGLLSFSGVPLKVWFYFGLLAAICSAGLGMVIIFQTLVFGVDVPGYASIFASILFGFSLQMISLGIVAEYLWRVFVEVKRRPIFIVSNTFGADLKERS